MKNYFLFLCQLVSVFCVFHAEIIQLCAKINFYAGKSIFHCLRYKHYGCWCGLGGSGTPVDGADSCCRDHDFCYDQIIAETSCNPYLGHYAQRRHNCVNHRETCLYKLCKCDDALAKCLTKHPYNKKYVDHRKKHQCNSNLSIDNVTLVEVPDASEKSFDKS